MNTIKVIVVKAGDRPKVQEIASTLEAMQSVVGGYIECLQLDTEDDVGVDLWCNEEGLISDLPPNRLTDGGTIIHGDFFIAASNEEGETIGLTAAQISRWMRRVETWQAAVCLN